MQKALFKSLAPDEGLYMPEVIPKFEDNFFKKLPYLSFQEISYYIASLFLSNDIESSKLKKILDSNIPKNFKKKIISR